MLSLTKRVGERNSENNSRPYIKNNWNCCGDYIVFTDFVIGTDAGYASARWKSTDMARN